MSETSGLPSVDEVAKWMHDTVGGCEDPFPTCGSTSDNYRSWASDLLSLFEAAVPRIKAEALRGLLQRIESEINHAEANGHHLCHDMQGVPPGEDVPAVRIDYLRAATAGDHPYYLRTTAEQRAAALGGGESRPEK